MTLDNQAYKIRQAYEAKLNEWKATTLAQAIEENRADAVDTSRAVLKGKIAEQMGEALLHREILRELDEESHK